MKPFKIDGLAETCPLCIDGDGRVKSPRPVFVVSGEGNYTGAICAPHLAALIRSQEPEKPKEPLLAQVARPANGPVPPVPVK